MPQLIVFAIAGAGLYAGCKWIARKAAQTVADAERVHREAAQRAADGQPAGVASLEWDEKAGVYRPRTQH